MPQIEHAHVSLINSVPNLLDLIGNPNRLSQVFTNLLDIAIKITPTEAETFPQGISVNDRVELRIKDSGAGISKEDFPQIFEYCYQNNPSRKG